MALKQLSRSLLDNRHSAKFQSTIIFCSFNNFVCKIYAMTAYHSQIQIRIVYKRSSLTFWFLWKPVNDKWQFHTRNKEDWIVANANPNTSIAYRLFFCVRWMSIKICRRQIRRKRKIAICHLIRFAKELGKIPAAGAQMPKARNSFQRWRIVLSFYLFLFLFEIGVVHSASLLSFTSNRSNRNYI